MTKSAKAVVISIAVVLGVGLGITALFANSNQGEPTMDKIPAIPAIDTVEPARIETATFALG